MATPSRNTFSERLKTCFRWRRDLCIRLFIGWRPKGWIAASWELSDKNKRAKYYRLTPRGRKQLAQEQSKWQAFSRAMGLILNPADQEGEMSWFIRKLNWLAQRGRKEDELREELKFHLDEEAEQLQAEGLAKDRGDLGRAARFGKRHFGSRETPAPRGLGYGLNNLGKIFATLCAR